MTYGGDDVSALILEVGSYWTKAGYAGEDVPKAAFPTAFGSIEGVADANGDVNMDSQRFYAENAFVFHEHMKIQHPLTNGLVTDWEGYEQIVDHAFMRLLRVNLNEHPLLIAEPCHTTSAQREKLAEMVFEKWNVPAFFLQRSAALSTFAAGRSSALVVDVGSEVSSVAPVYDGYLLNKGIVTQNLAGRTISEQALLQLKKEYEYQPQPAYRVIRKRLVDAGKQPEPTLRKLNHVDPSFDLMARLRVADAFKESVCEVSEWAFNEEKLALRPSKAFEFPDGYHRNFGAARFEPAEVLFNPDGHLLSNDTMSGQSYQSIQQMVLKSLQSCDLDVRPQLLNSIVVTGGTSLFPGFADRLHNELSALMPGNKIKIYAPGNSIERRFSTWIGGSILGSLGMFHQLWVSKQEYEEGGVGLLEKRFQ